MEQILFDDKVVSKFVLLLQLGHNFVCEHIDPVVLQGLHVISQIMQELASFLSHFLGVVI